MFYTNIRSPVKSWVPAPWHHRTVFYFVTMRHVRRYIRKFFFLLAAVPVFLLGQAAFGQWGLIGIWLGVVLLQQVIVVILDARKERRASR
jgi:hypothetical protein